MKNDTTQNLMPASVQADLCVLSGLEHERAAHLSLAAASWNIAKLGGARENAKACAYYFGLLEDKSDYFLSLRTGETTLGFLWGRTGPKRKSTPIRAIKYLLASRTPGLPLLYRLRLVVAITSTERTIARISQDWDAELVLFVVSPAAKGKGLGTLLADKFLERCQELGLRRVGLFADCECNSDFYLKRGFKAGAVFHDHYQSLSQGKPSSSRVYYRRP